MQSLAKHAYAAVHPHTACTGIAHLKDELARVEALGAGVTANVDLRAAVERVLGDSSFRTAARAIGDAGRAAGGAAGVVRDLEELL